MSIAMFKSIRYSYSLWDILIMRYDNWIKTTFLDDNLDESIYMIQLDGFIAKSQENLVCKLHKSIYGLT